MSDAQTSMVLLKELLAIDSPSGDEGLMADWLEAHAHANWPEAVVERFGDSVIVMRGERPSLALFAHIDTTGFTLGYEKRLITIGGPALAENDTIRLANGHHSERRVKRLKDGGWKVSGNPHAAPGTCWVYASKPSFKRKSVRAPYLDNRGGVWAALQALERCPRIAVAFTAGEEHSGQGAFVSARRLWEHYGVSQALIADITWDTKHVKCGRGVAISQRDRSVPRQRFLDRVLLLAAASEIPFQREIESSGGSDGASIERSGCPIEWVFVGAPEKRPHASTERIRLSDLHAMADMLVYLADKLQDEE